MKKTIYIQPETTVILIKTESLLGTNTFDGNQATFDPESMSGGGGGDAASRGGWFDDED